MFHSSPCKKENPQKNSKLFFINGKSNSIQSNLPYLSTSMNMESRVWSKKPIECNAYMNIVAIYVYIVHTTTITTMT